MLRLVSGRHGATDTNMISKLRCANGNAKHCRSTPPFLQNMFVAWNSHGVDVFLKHCVDVNGILWTV